jgi:5-methylcytosine-specific restriction endonuclease McrA
MISSSTTHCGLTKYQHQIFVISQKGVTPPANEWQIDHIDPKNNGGSNSYDNAQVLSRQENRLKSDK